MIHIHIIDGEKTMDDMFLIEVLKSHEDLHNPGYDKFLWKSFVSLFSLLQIIENRSILFGKE